MSTKKQSRRQSTKKRTQKVQTHTFVACRVRPTYGEEKDCVIKMSERSTVLQNPLTKIKYQFMYDASMWSFDQSPNYVSQEELYKIIGKRALDDTRNGYNVTLFAYGQTGSGKTYSVFGPPEKKRPSPSEFGMLPRLVKDLYRRISIDRKRDTEWNISVSSMEIYKNKVSDLLNPNDQQQSGLKVREHTELGPYVEGLRRIHCKTSKKLLTMIARANDNRVTRRTVLNDYSSRSHCIIQIFMQRIKNVSKIQSMRGERNSILSIIDLAGSARDSDLRQISGKTASERNAINLSLTSLGKVIDRLVVAPRKSSEESYIPYRDNQLTWLLKEALSGNSKTMLLATISPASNNLEETLSTLRFADRVKKIRTYARLNEDSNPTILIEELRDVIAGLQRRLIECETRRRQLEEELEGLRGQELVEKNELLKQKMQHDHEMEELKSEYQEKTKELNLNLQKLTQSVQMLQERKKVKDEEAEQRMKEIEELKKDLAERTQSYTSFMKKKEEELGDKNSKSEEERKRYEDQMEKQRQAINKAKDLLSLKEKEMKDEVDKLNEEFSRKSSEYLGNSSEKSQKIESLEKYSREMENRLKDSALKNEEMVKKLEFLGMKFKEVVGQKDDVTKEKESYKKKTEDLDTETKELLSSNQQLKTLLQQSQVELSASEESKTGAGERHQLEIVRMNNEKNVLREQFEMEKSKLNQEKSDLEDQRKVDLKNLKDQMELQNATELEKMRYEFEDGMNKKKGEFDNQKSVWEERVKELKNEKEQLERDKIIFERDLEKEYLDKRKKVVQDFHLEFEKMKARHEVEMERASKDNKSKVTKLGEDITDLTLQCEKLKMEKDKTELFYRDELRDVKKKWEDKFDLGLKEQEMELNDEKEKMKLHYQKIEQALGQKLRNKELENETLQQEAALMRKTMEAQFEEEKEGMKRQFDEKLDELKIETEREKEKQKLKHKYEVEDLQRQLQNSKDDLENKSQEFDKELLRKEEDLQKSREMNTKLLEEIIKWKGVQKMRSNEAFSTLEEVILDYEKESKID